MLVHFNYPLAPVSPPPCSLPGISSTQEAQFSFIRVGGRVFNVEPNCRRLRSPQSTRRTERLCVTSPLSSLPPSLTLSFFLPSLSPDPISSQRKRTERGQEAACSRSLGRPLIEGVPAQQHTLPSVNCQCCCQEHRRHGQELPAPCRHCLCRRARSLLG